MANQITPNPSVPSQVVQEVKFPKFVNNLGIIPTSYKDSMSYYECLAWLCKYLEETVIPTVNENGEAVEELQGLYVQLNNYVTNYFDNLDVQEEINNKLDDMTESGYFENLLLGYVKTQKIYDTTQEMLADENLVDGMKVKTLGYYAINDGGNADFIITDTTNSSEIQFSTSSTGLYAEMIIKNSTINLKSVGAKSSSDLSTVEDNKDYFEIVTNYAINHTLKVIIPEGLYGLTNLEFSQNMGGLVFEGISRGGIGESLEKGACIVGMTSQHNKLFEFNGTQNNRVNYIDFKNLKINGRYNKETCFDIVETSHIYFDNVEIYGFSRNGISLTSTWDSLFNNLFIHQCGYSNTHSGIRFSSGRDNNNNLKFNNCRFESNVMHLLFDYASTTQTEFSNCKFEDTGDIERIGSTIIINGNYLTFSNCFFNCVNDYHMIQVKGNSTNANATLTEFIGCQFSQGKSIKFTDNAQGGSLIGCNFLNLNLENPIILNDKQKLSNCNFYVFHNSAADDLQGLIELKNNCIIENNTFVFNLTFSASSYIFKITGIANIIKGNYFSDSIVTSANQLLYNDFNTNQFEIQSRRNTVRGVGEENLVIDIAFSNQFQIGTDTNISQIKHAYNGAKLFIYTNGYNITIDAGISAVGSVELEALKFYELTYFNTLWRVAKASN